MCHRAALGFVFFGLLLCTGCGRAASSADPSTAEENLFHTLDHHIPEHKPADFAQALESLRSRHERLRRLDPGTEEARVQGRELLDILRWLPEIAGDSDMPEDQWNVVDRQAAALLELTSKTARLTDEEFRRSFDDAIKLLAELPSVAPQPGTHP